MRRTILLQSMLDTQTPIISVMYLSGSLACHLQNIERSIQSSERQELEKL